MKKLIVFLAMAVLAFMPVVGFAGNDEPTPVNGLVYHPFNPQDDNDRVVIKLKKDEETDYWIMSDRRVRYKLNVTSKDCGFVVIFGDRGERRGCIENEYITQKFKLRALDKHQKIIIKSSL